MIANPRPSLRCTATQPLRHASLLALVLLAGLTACRSRESPPTPGTTAGVSSASPSKDQLPPQPASSASAATLKPTLVTPEPVTFPVGGVVGARVGPQGFLLSKSGAEKNHFDLVLVSATEERTVRTVTAPRAGMPHFVTTPTHSFIEYEESGGTPDQLFMLDDTAPSLLAGALPSEWAFDLPGGRALLVGTRGGKSMVNSRWHVSLMGPDGVKVASSADRNESAWGAAAALGGYVIAVREPTTQAAEPGRSALVRVDAEGRVTGREPIGPQRPAGLAATDHGWLVVLGEGTLGKKLRDAVLVARAPNQTDFRLLMSDIDSPNGLRQRGNWVCLTELPDPGDAYVVHCVDPERGLHVQTPPMDGLVSIVDIEVVRTPRVWISRHRYKGKSDDEVLTIALP